MKGVTQQDQGRGHHLGALLDRGPVARPRDRGRARRAGPALRRRRARVRPSTSSPRPRLRLPGAGSHKWLFGPRGTGIVWAKDFGPLTELIPSFDGFENGARLTPGGYNDFEHRWAVADAFAIQQRITRKAVVERTVALASQLKEGLQDVDRSRHHPAATGRLGRASSASTSRACCRPTRVLEPARAGHRRQRDAVPHVVPPPRSLPRHHPRAGRRGDRGR